MKTSRKLMEEQAMYAYQSVYKSDNFVNNEIRRLSTLLNKQIAKKNVKFY